MGETIMRIEQPTPEWTDATTIEELLYSGLSNSEDTPVSIRGWIVRRRTYRTKAFYDLKDETGTLQLVVMADSAAYEVMASLPLESAVLLEGFLHFSSTSPEVHVENVKVLGRASLNLSPRPNEKFESLSETFADQVVSYRHLYLRNDKNSACLRAQSDVLGYIHNWFRSNKFIEFSAPVLTALPLYEDRSAIAVNLHGEQIYLTQCVGYYLEAAAHEFGRVYNIGPSFRAEESRSKRHLTEYWHIKGELIFVTREDLINIVEKLIAELTEYCVSSMQHINQTLGTRVLDVFGDKPHFPRLTYREAIERLNARNINEPLMFGKSLSSEDQTALARDYCTPFWIVGNPRTIEPFPYEIDPNDIQCTMTADLIAPDGFGELLGIAEKIADSNELRKRMAEKDKDPTGHYRWLVELRDYGCVPHGGFGMGLERILRWIFGTQHVRDFSPFPRLFNRKVYP